MQYGICNLSIVPIRIESSDKSELVSQLLYGEHFKIIDQRKHWCKIRVAFDDYEGWIDKKQYHEINKEEYKNIEDSISEYSEDLIEYVQTKDQQLLLVPMGSSLNGLSVLEHHFDGTKIAGINDKSNLVVTAFSFLNAPFLWGGKTPLGIDCSGFTQMVYRLNGYKLLRDVSQQSTQGDALSFIEESDPGDLAFFDDVEGNIIHVGIILKDNYIIHVHGKVRIDRLDHLGIYNSEEKKHTHKLRVIKKII